MTVWIQRHDFTSRALDDTAIGAALHQFEITDWAAEDRLSIEKQNAGEEFCPAGIGFVHPSGNILHLCPNGSDRMMVHYHYRITKRILGIFSKQKQEKRTFDSIPKNEAESLIRLHYADNFDAVLKAAKSIKRGGTPTS